MKATLKVFLVLEILNLASSLPRESQSSATTLDLTRYGPEIYNGPDKLAGKKLAEWSQTKSKGNPEEQGTYFEGDIMISAEARNGVVLASNKWIDGKIPFEIKGSFTQVEKNMISDALDLFKKNTCIRFVPRAAEKDYVVFENQLTGCWSHVGRHGGNQTINLQTPGCTVKVGTVLHEVLHATGFYHEQNRSDRDDYVKVNFVNIPKDKRVNFEKIPEDEISSYGVGYDIKSVLHYSSFAFSKNNQRTIEARSSPSMNELMGQRDGFSDSDIRKIKAMYKC